MIDSDSVVEAMIKDKGLTAPRVMPKAIDALVASLIFKVHHFEGTTTMVALALLPNGFSVAQGHSACASPENFNKEVGEKVAVDNARDAARQKLWELEGYVLKQQLSAPAPAFTIQTKLESKEVWLHFGHGAMCLNNVANDLAEGIIKRNMINAIHLALDLAK